MGNSSVRQEKEQIVAEVANKLSQSTCAIVTDYRGLNVAEITELRKQFREAGVDYKVVKNTLLKLATANANLSELDAHISGPTAIAFSQNDPVAPAKIVVDFAKKHENLEVKGGVVEGKVVGVEQIKALAELPSREGLLSMLLSVLQAPVRNFALAVKAVADQKDNGAQSA
ncbi:MAG TPA: 50S ribosomal protein L10 [Bacilli bacterium]